MTNETGPFTAWLGRWLGYDNVTDIEQIRPGFGSQWAIEHPLWIVVGILCGLAIAFGFYLRLQPRATLKARLLLAGLRGITLAGLVLLLADPILELTFVSTPKPTLWILVDGSESMTIADDEPIDLRRRHAEATGLDPESNPARVEQVRSLLRRDQDNLFEELGEKYRLQFFRLDRPGQTVPLAQPNGDELTDDDQNASDYAWVGDQLFANGEVTALGNAFEELARRHRTGSLSGALVISDFANNAGPAPETGAKRLGVPVSTLGIGSRSARDLSVSVQAPLTIKMEEQSTIEVTLSHQDFDGAKVTVRVIARETSAMLDDPNQPPLEIGTRSVTLSRPVETLEFPFTPEASGRYELQTIVGRELEGSIQPLPGELVDGNNIAKRDVTIIDDYMRLLFVEYEPTWEWRFVKEVFHRDKLVGMRGFRTFLRSADPSVKTENNLFVERLTQSRADFFRNDVIFLGDMPATSLSNRFCEMTKEFVSQFGGGLVVVAGPRFGPGELANTPLGDMLPVVVDPDSTFRDDRSFRPERTPYAEQYDFMTLGESEAENEKAWNNLGRLPWYQPVRLLEPSSSTILLAHPTDRCEDGKTPQPLIAVRKYGRGEVIYIGFNEFWRIRRMYGEQYYRQFWGQMIHRLGLSHALGNQKRFVVRTDRQRYRANESVQLTIEAYDENFEPLSADDLPSKSLRAIISRPGQTIDGVAEQRVTVSELTSGVFQRKLSVFEPGEYRVRVVDPITNEQSDPIFFQVVEETIERREATRNVALQETIATETGGRSYDLTNISRFASDFDPPRLSERQVEIRSMWDTWLVFVLVIGLLLSEWLVRKWVHLS